MADGSGGMYAMLNMIPLDRKDTVSTLRALLEVVKSTVLLIPQELVQHLVRVTFLEPGKRQFKIQNGVLGELLGNLCVQSALVWVFLP
jgi:hypothetical protein